MMTFEHDVDDEPVRQMSR